MALKADSLVRMVRLAAFIVATMVIAADVVRSQMLDNLTMTDTGSGVINNNSTGSNGNTGGTSNNNNNGNSVSTSNNNYGSNNGNNNNYGNNNNNYNSNSDGNGYNSNNNANNNYGSGNSGSNGYGNGSSNNNNYGSSNNNGYGSSSNNNNNNYGSSNSNNYGSSNSNSNYGSGNSGSNNYGSSNNNNNNYGSSSNNNGGGGYGSQGSNNGNYGNNNNNNNGYSGNSGSNGYGSSNNYGSSGSSNSNNNYGSSNNNNYGSGSSGTNNYGSNTNSNNYGNNNNNNNYGSSSSNSNYGTNNNNTNNNYGISNNNAGTGGLVYGSRYNSTNNNNNNNNNNGRCIVQGTSALYGRQIFYLKLRSSNLAQWNPRSATVGGAGSNFTFRAVTNSPVPNDFFDNVMFLARGDRGVTFVSMPFSKWYPQSTGPNSIYETIMDYAGSVPLALVDNEEALTVRAHFSVTTFDVQFYPYPTNLVSDRNSDPRLASAGIFLSSGQAVDSAGLEYGIVATNRAIWAIYGRSALLKGYLTAPWMAFRAYRKLQNRVSSRDLIDAAIQYDSVNQEVNYYLNCVKVWSIDKFGVRPNSTDNAVVTNVVDGVEADIPEASLTQWKFFITAEKPLDNTDPNAGNAAASNTEGLVRFDTTQTYLVPTSFWDPAEVRTNVLYGQGLTAFFYDISFSLLNVTLDGTDR